MAGRTEQIQTPFGMATYTVYDCDNCHIEWTRDNYSTLNTGPFFYSVLPSIEYFLGRQPHSLIEGFSQIACSVKCFRALMDPLMEKYYKLLAEIRKEQL